MTTNTTELTPSQDTTTRTAEESVKLGLTAATIMCHKNAKKWWHDPITGEKLNRNKGEHLMLIVSEIAEAMEGERKNLMDDHLPHRKMVVCELADALIRIFDYCGGFGYPEIAEVVLEKLEYNKTRKDHSIEERLKENGKKW